MSAAIRSSTQTLIGDTVTAAQDPSSPRGFQLTKGELQSLIKKVRDRGARPGQVDESDKLLIAQAWNDRLGAGYYATQPARDEYVRQQAKGFRIGRAAK